jgi:hypothetical protein
MGRGGKTRGREQVSDYKIQKETEMGRGRGIGIGQKRVLIRVSWSQICESMRFRGK